MSRQNVASQPCATSLRGSGTIYRASVHNQFNSRLRREGYFAQREGATVTPLAFCGQRGRVYEGTAAGCDLRAAIEQLIGFGSDDKGRGVAGKEYRNSKPWRSRLRVILGLRVCYLGLRTMATVDPVKPNYEWVGIDGWQGVLLSRTTFRRRFSPGADFEGSFLRETTIKLL